MSYVNPKENTLKFPFLVYDRSCTVLSFHKAELDFFFGGEWGSIKVTFYF